MRRTAFPTTLPRNIDTDRITPQIRIDTTLRHTLQYIPRLTLRVQFSAPSVGGKDRVIRDDIRPDGISLNSIFHSFEQRFRSLYVHRAIATVTTASIGTTGTGRFLLGNRVQY